MTRSVSRVAVTVAVRAAAAVVVAAVAFATVVVILGRMPRPGERSAFAAWLVVAVVAAAVAPFVARRFERMASRLSNRSLSTPADLVRTFTRSMSRSVPLDELLLQLVETLRGVLSLDSAEVWIAAGDKMERSVSLPDRPRIAIRLTANEQSVVAHAGVSGPEWARVWLPAIEPGDGEPLRVVPVGNAGELLGMIVVRARAGREPFTAHEEQALAELARHVGLALHNVRLDSQLQASLEELRGQAHALQASRARLVAAADGERRRLERDLHDGAQQHLIALAMGIRAVREMLETDPKHAAAMLGDLSSSVEATVEELRALAHGIYPPLLADRGLGDALSAAARRASIRASVTATRLNRYAPEVESAVYFCCLEALQNAAKHAGEGRTATVRVWEEAGALRFDVADDGAGFDVDTARPGGGFANMSDRLGAIGGSVRIESAPGDGTVVSGTIPLPKS